MYVEDASADARSKDPTCVTSVKMGKLYHNLFM